MNGLASYIEHLQTNLYHPRSDAHSNAFCKAIVRDLIDHCAPLARRISSGDLVAALNQTIKVNQNEWNTDLVLGPPPDSPVPISTDELVRWEAPSIIEIAIEVKGVMTEHGKARKNRLRDLSSFHSYAHQYNNQIIAVGAVVVNIAEYFWSPTRPPDDVTYHKNLNILGPGTVDIFRNIPLRNFPSNGPGLEGLCVVVVRHDNLRKNPSLPADAPSAQPTELVHRPPAPQVGDPLHYSAMIHAICRAYQDRWCGSQPAS